MIQKPDNPIFDIVHYMNYVDEIDVTVKYLDANGNEISELFRYTDINHENSMEAAVDVLCSKLIASVNDAGITNIQSFLLEGANDSDTSGCAYDGPFPYVTYSLGSVYLYDEDCHHYSFGGMFDLDCRDVLRHFHFHGTLDEGQSLEDSAHGFIEALYNDFWNMPL